MKENVHNKHEHVNHDGIAEEKCHYTVVCAANICPYPTKSTQDKSCYNLNEGEVHLIIQKRLRFFKARHRGQRQSEHNHANVGDSQVRHQHIVNVRARLALDIARVQQESVYCQAK